MPENTRRESIRIKDVEILGFFPGADKFDRHAGDRFHRQRRTAAGIAVELGQHQSRERERFVKRLGHIDCFLSQRAIGHE